jgi:transcriptional regulator with XRE-family HTH domain/KaiC/GvpD/RAD55 family RecA-like ATPase
LDQLLGGLFIGDNVVWHDDAGSLASVFCLNFMKASQNADKPLIYVTFDRSPRNLIDKLGALAENPSLTILDCFTSGKGDGSDVFLRFYRDSQQKFACNIVKVDKPDSPEQVSDALYGIHSSMTGDVRFVFESITGMQELWGGEEQVRNFYTHSCPRLYELNTVAYWIMEKHAHSMRFRAHINQIAQVAIELSIKRGTTSLTILKAEKRSLENLQQPVVYWTKNLKVTFEDDSRTSGRPGLGLRIKEVRISRGASQSELAKLVGVTPSTISQVESNLIYPSLPALLKMAEVLSVDVSVFFASRSDAEKQVIFPVSSSTESKLPNVREDGVSARMLTPVFHAGQADLYLIKITPGAKLHSHFFVHKGEEAGYLLSGVLQITLDEAGHRILPGDVVYLTKEIPTQWVNPGPEIANLLWIKIK